MKFLHYLLLLTFLSASQLPASEIHYPKIVLDDIEITEGWVREVPQGNPNTAGYLKIKNSGKEEIKLINVKAEFAEMSEFHLMKEEYGIMKMTPLKDGVLIPASSTVFLEPGGMHIMFMKLNTSLKLSEKHIIELTFENIGDISISMIVKKISSTNFHTKD